jgi:hypothetical protein
MKKACPRLEEAFFKITFIEGAVSRSRNHINGCLVTIIIT